MTRERIDFGPIEGVLRKDMGMLERWGRKLMTIVEMVTPIDTGRLQQSASLFVQGTLVETTDRGMGTPDLEPGSMADVEIAFSTPKSAREAARVYYTDEGGKWFDYAEFVWQERRWTDVLTDSVLEEALWQSMPK